MPFSRRQFFQTLPLAALPAFAPRLSFTATVPSPAASPVGPLGDVVVCIFQRGGVDGLNMVVPYGDTQYSELRPNLAIAPPGQGTNSAINLDDFFGLHPALDALKPIYDGGDLAVVHATGSPHPTHSHFDASDFMERAFLDKGSIFSGWLGRRLESLNTQSESPFRAVGIGVAPQTSLRGEGDIVPVAFSSIADFDILVRDQDEKDLITDSLYAVYDDDTDLDYQAWQTLEATALLSQHNPDQLTPAHGAVYPTSRFGQAFLQVGQLIKTPALGLEAVCVDIGGWDTHNQEATLLPGLLADFADSLAAFYTDMGSRMDRITVITMSEFGRRVYENAAGGTDHGHGNCLLAIGGGVNGGQVFADWPGLDTAQLYGNGDLDVTIDWRIVLGELVQKRLLNPYLEEVFPGYSMSNFLGIFQDNS